MRTQDRPRVAVGICESQPATAEGLALMLSRTPDLACRWTSNRIEDMLLCAYAEPVQLLILDGGLGYARVSEAIRAYRIFAPKARVLVWAEPLTPSAGSRFVQAGAHGWILKSAPADVLLCCLRTLLSGGEWPPRKVEKEAARFDGESRLTTRERQVLALLLENRSAQEIAEELGMAIGTVKLHSRWVYMKLGVSGRRGLLLAEANALAGREEDLPNGASDPRVADRRVDHRIDSRN